MQMLTVDTITDAHIYELMRTRPAGDLEADRLYRAALHERDMVYRPARARCAEIINARNQGR